MVARSGDGDRGGVAGTGDGHKTLNIAGSLSGGNENRGLHRSCRVGCFSCRHKHRHKAAGGGADRTSVIIGFHITQPDFSAGVDVNARVVDVAVATEADAANVVDAAYLLKSGCAAHVNRVPLGVEFGPGDLNVLRSNNGVVIFPGFLDSVVQEFGKRAAVRVLRDDNTGSENVRRWNVQNGRGSKCRATSGELRIRHLIDIDVGAVTRILDQPHRVSGDRIVHAGGPQGVGIGGHIDVAAENSQASLRNSIGQVI